MNTAPQELLKDYVRSQNFTSTGEIMEAMKEMFREVIQTVMEDCMSDYIQKLTERSKTVQANTGVT